MPINRSHWPTRTAATAIVLALAPAVLGSTDVRADDGAWVAPYEGGTWSIVAIDVVTGDVGVAAATCLPMDATALAALVPGKGAAAVQAEFEIDNRDAVLQRLDMGQRADEIVAALANAEHDELYGRRQYGIVTLHEGGVVIAGFTGEDNGLWNGHVESVEHAVTVQGNFLAGEDEVNGALEAFIAPDEAGVHLADRLMRALEAASAGGGDWRCNDHGVVQTALSAFISVARADQPPFASRHLGDAGTDFPELPWLHLSVVEANDGPNPIVELRRRYDAWRVDNLPPCHVCGELAIEVPPGGNGVPASDATAVRSWIEAPPATGVPDLDVVVSTAGAGLKPQTAEAQGAGPSTAPVPADAADDSVPVGTLIAICTAIAGGSVILLWSLLRKRGE